MKLPVDLTPMQRAKLKLYSHLVMIALFNGLLAAVAAISKSVPWETIGTITIAQLALAGLDALVKYYKASGQLPLSTLFDLIRSEVTSNAANSGAAQIPSP